MSYPTISNKYEYPSLTKAGNLIAQTYPKLKSQLVAKGINIDTMILTYDNSILLQVVKENKSQRLNIFTGETFYLPKLGNCAITGNFGIGAPAVISLIELYIALGIKRFYTIGYAGGLLPDHSINDLILCSQAIPDDGVTQHYLGNIRIVDADPLTMSLIEERAVAKKIQIEKGKIWSTAAIFRETKQEINHFKDQGVIAVDMEAASILAIAKIYDIDVAIFLIISDKIENNDWAFTKGDDKIRKQKIRDMLQLCII